MFILWAIVASIVIALIRGGKLIGLAQIDFRHGWLAMLALAAQIATMVMPIDAGGTVGALRTGLVVGSYVLLVLVIGLNYRVAGLSIVGLGMALNLVAMLANGGYMPVTPQALQRAGLEYLAPAAETGSLVEASKDILLPREMTHLWILSDVLVIPPPVGIVLSIGDLLLALGAFIFFQRAMCVSVQLVGPEEGNDTQSAAGDIP